MENDLKYKRFIEFITTSSDGDGCQLIGVALFGLGRAGTIQFQNLLSSVRTKLIYVVEESAERLEAAEKKYKHKVATTKFVNFSKTSEILADPEVKAVLVCTPTFTHKEIVCKGLAAGKHVFCEKPIAESDEDVRECYRQAKKNGVTLFCAFNRRYDPGLSRIKSRLLNNDIGNVYLVKTTARDSPIPSLEYLRSSGGIFHDCAVHDIDAVCWLLGEKPTKVQVFGSLLSPALAELKGKDFDTVTMSFQFASGRLALIDLSRNASYGYDQRCEVYGSKGMLENRNHRPNQIQMQTSEAIQQDPILYSFPSRYCDSYVIELEHFIDLVSGKAKLEIQQEDVLAVTKIASACEKAAFSGTVQDIKWD